MPTKRPLPVATVLQLADGRSLAYSELGDPKGTPVLAFHGTPGSRLQLADAHEAAAAGGVRLVLPDRPGYGLSSWSPRRRLRDWAGDVEALADHLGLDRFAVVGVSGGGPHALACAAILGQRVTAVGVVSGVGPVADPELAATLPPAARVLWRLRRLVRPLLVGVISVALAAWRRAPRLALRLVRPGLPASDAEIVSRPEVRRHLLAEASVVPSPTTARAAAQDLVLFGSRWGLPLERIEQHVVLWHGDADNTVPIVQARHLARALPHAMLHEHPGEGHLFVEDVMGEVLATVTGR